jgi:hypothetical protein
LNISFDYKLIGLLIPLSIILSLGISYFLYYRNAENSTLSGFQKGFLAFLRFLMLSILFLFLLSPIIETTKRIKQIPILAIAFDNSESVKPYSSSIDQVKQAISDQLGDKYQLEFWAFGEKLENTEKFTGNDSKSDYGQLFKMLKNNSLNRNIGAVVLIGDGIYNQGQNPANIVSEIKFPIYSLGIGDTIRKTDAQIIKVKTNKVAFLKNKFPVEIEMKFLKLKGKIAYVSIEHQQKEIYSGAVAVNSDDQFKLDFINIEATETGLQHYKIKVKPFDEEQNIRNNEYEFVINILENKQRILMLSDGPHPDMGAIRNGLLKLENYDIKVLTGNLLPDSLSNFSLIILNQIPSSRNTASTLLSTIKASRIPVLFLVGPNTFLQQFNSLDLGLKVLPSTNTEEVQTVFDSNFSLFVLSDETMSNIENSPPLVVPFGDTQLNAAIQPLGQQKIRNIKTDKTMMAFGSIQGRKLGFIVGEGLWRWRLHCFQTNGNHDSFNEFIQKIIQYLALKENEDNFNIYHPALFQETDAIEFRAELYNDSYELVNTPDIEMKLTNDSLQEFLYQFDRVDDFYLLNTGSLKPGDYTFEASTKLGNQQFTEKGSFSVSKSELEVQNTQADFGLLYQISSITGGNFFPIGKYGTLLDTIVFNKQITVHQYQQTYQTEWINLKTIFVLLLLLLGIEWVFRKYWGIY